eukprot:761205-Hanusia_phi.AAC.5
MKEPEENFPGSQAEKVAAETVPKTRMVHLKRWEQMEVRRRTLLQVVDISYGVICHLALKS